MVFLASTDLIDPKEAPKSVKSLGIVFLILVLGHIGSQGAVEGSLAYTKSIELRRKFRNGMNSITNIYFVAKMCIIHLFRQVSKKK